MPLFCNGFVVNAPITRKGPQALDIKSATIYTIRLVLHSANTEELLEALTQRMQEAGSFFQDEPVIIDVSALYEDIEWDVLLQALRQHQLHPIGVTGSKEHEQSAAMFGLASVELSTTKVTLDIPEPIENTSTARPAPLILEQTLRSGQRFVAPEGDLIVHGMVGQGAEIIATGNVYVHGPLRGKVVAGAQGDTSAFIIATEFDPELIVIAGVYSVIEDPHSNPLHKQSVLIQLDGDSLKYKRLS